MKLVNHRFQLAARPIGMVKRSDFTYGEASIPELGDGEILVKVLYVSLDPAMRSWMNDAKSYIPPVALGDVMRAYAAGRVIASEDPAFRAGDYVSGLFGVQEYAVARGKGVTKVDTQVAPLPVHLGLLGQTGLTAYFGLLDVGQPKEGDTVVVSAAAGATGMAVGQIAKIKGCRVVGIAGGKDKCDYITGELGFDAAIDYKNADVKSALREHAPKGIDVYYDNVGGNILEAALGHLARGARVVICGAISQYNSTTPAKGPSNYMSILLSRASVRGILVIDYADRFDEAVREMSQWIAAGKLKSREYVVEGLETFPDAFLKLFKGQNIGKLILEVAKD